MTQAQHFEKYRKDLDVHRKTPGSPYAVDDSCETLCRKCHGPEPRRPRGSLGKNRLSIWITREIRLALRLRAAKDGTTIKKLVNGILKEALAEELAELHYFKETTGAPLTAPVH